MGAAQRRAARVRRSIKAVVGARRASKCCFNGDHAGECTADVLLLNKSCYDFSAKTSVVIAAASIAVHSSKHGCCWLWINF